MNKYSRRSAANLATAHPELRTIFKVVLARYDHTVLQGHRDKALQDAYYAAGNSQLTYPNSKHNSVPSRAVDVVPYPIDWDNRERFHLFAGYAIGVAAGMGVKLRWGGDWDGDGETLDNYFDDLVHFELA